MRPSTSKARQAAIFEQVAAQIRVRIGHPFALHAANSAATFRGMAAGTDIARCGIAIYGLAPSPQVGLAAGMRPSLSLMSRLGRVHLGRVGDGIGYGHTYVCEAEEWFGLIPLGYADGYRRASRTGRGSALPVSVAPFAAMSAWIRW